MMTAPVYNTIGVTYDVTRRADSEILAKLIQHLSPKPEGKYLDIGCGSGNYTHALFNTGIEMVGIDISEEMLSKAKDKNNSINWVCGDARQMPFSKDSFDGAICVLATHHIKDIETVFQEVFRVIREGYFVIFTSFPEQMKMYWLNHYFPQMMKRARDNMVSYEKIQKALSGAGFTHVQMDKFFVSDTLQDWFLHAGKYRPHLYLDPKVRAGISTFALEENQEEVREGIEKIQQDIHSSAIQDVITSYESDLGDYAFVVCRKTSIYSIQLKPGNFGLA